MLSKSVTQDIFLIWFFFFYFVRLFTMEDLPTSSLVTPCTKMVIHNRICNSQTWHVIPLTHIQSSENHQHNFLKVPFHSTPWFLSLPSLPNRSNQICNHNWHWFLYGLFSAEWRGSLSISRAINVWLHFSASQNFRIKVSKVTQFPNIYKQYLKLMNRLPLPFSQGYINFPV